MRLCNKQNIYSLKNETSQRHIGEYFQIVEFKNKYHLYYPSQNFIKLVVSSTLSFIDKKPSIVLDNSPGGSFCIIENDDKLFMLCGLHGSNKENEEFEVLDLVWPNQKRTLLDWKVKRADRKNGMYLLSSSDGIKWNEEYEFPVLHGYVSSDSCQLGEVCFDTSPYVLKHADQFFYYGRLNCSLDERRIYVRKSTDLINWSSPIKIDVVNEANNSFKKNYYNPVVFNYNKKFYMVTPYFEACGTEARKCINGCTLLLCSMDGIVWETIDSFLFHDGKYKHRVNDVYCNEEKVSIFYRENILQDRQFLTSYDLQLVDVR